MDKDERTQVECPRCGYKIPLLYDGTAESKGVFVTCKGRNCKHVFEVKIKQGQQIK